MKIEVPKMQSALLEALRFVISAKSKEVTRYAINHILVEKNKFVGTDGKRLHIADIEHNFDTGLYEVVKCNKSIVLMLKNDDAGNFPKYEDIIPKHEQCFQVKYGENPKQITTILAGLGKKDVFVNYEYLKPIVEVGETWEIQFGEPDRPIYFKSEVLSAVLLPFNGEPAKYEAVKA